jgi:geranylgeranyl diphosphate synthase type II
MSEYAASVNAALDAIISGGGERTGELTEAMRYSVFAGGKRVRPALFLAAVDAAKPAATETAASEAAVRFAAAIELIHVYSLIHDDLPAMDDDDFRRGRPSNHKAFGEAMAILAGDALLNLAYEVMAAEVKAGFSDGSSERKAAAALEIAGAAGRFGMIGGQAADILSENRPTDKDDLLYIHANKTAALIRASLTAGAIFAGAGDEFIAVTREAGFKFGVAFQIKDDLLDLTAEGEAAGKTVGSDARKGKVTYITVFGKEKAVRDCEELSLEAGGLFKSVGAFFLERMTERALERKV